MGKTREELMEDLKLYLGRLRDDPRSITDRLRVAAIQLRLGRVDEAMIHYEGVLGGYVSSDQLMSAAALCQRLLTHFKDLPQIQKIYDQVTAKLSADDSKPEAPEEITAEHLPPEHLDEIDFLDILLQADEEAASDDAGTARFSLSDVEATRNVRAPASRDEGKAEEADTERAMESSAPTDRWSPADEPILLDNPKEVPLFPEGTDRLSPEYAAEQEDEQTEEQVLLLTKKKK